MDQKIILQILRLLRILKKFQRYLFLAAKAQLNTCTCVSVCVSVRLWSKLNFSLFTPLYTLSKLSQAVTSCHKLSKADTCCHKPFTCNVPSVCIPFPSVCIPLLHVMFRLCAFLCSTLCPFVSLCVPLCPFIPLYTSLQVFTCFYTLYKLSSSQDLVVGLVISECSSVASIWHPPQK